MATKKKALKKKSKYTGRPTSYSQTIVNQALKYLDDYQTEHQHPFPSLVGLCKVLGRGKTTFYRWWKEDKDKPEWGDIMETLNEIQELVLLNKSSIGALHPTIAALILGRHGYHKKVDNELSGPGGGPIQSKTLMVTGVESKHKDSK